MEKKTIVKYLDYDFCVLLPVYYEHEKKPAWINYFVGSKEECEKVFLYAPDYLLATPEENKRNRENKIKEYLFLMEIGKHKEDTKIKHQYHF